jgi:hypothetical protein
MEESATSGVSMDANSGEGCRFSSRGGAAALSDRMPGYPLGRMGQALLIAEGF